MADAHWPNKNVKIKVDALGIDWIETNPDRAASAPKQAAGVQAAAAAAATPPSQPPRPPAPNAAVEQARRDFERTYGNEAGVKIISASDGYDWSGRVVNAHLQPMGRGDGLDEQARAEIAALPAYGSPGWGEAKRELTRIRQRAAQRAVAGQPATPAQSEREALAGFEGVQTGTWDQVRAAAGNQLLTERNKAMARRWEPKR